LRPTKFRRIDSTTVSLSWDDGHNGPVPLTLLRDACPCAGCKGETILLESYRPPEPDKMTPGRYELKGAEPVGNYGMKLVWGDGHGEGIYTWEHLRSLCSCESCLSKRMGSAETP
jgi:DUF971 family protein